MKNDSRDITGTMGRAASIVFGAPLVECFVTAYFGPAWEGAATLASALAVILGDFLWFRRNEGSVTARVSYARPAHR